MPVRPERLLLFRCRLLKIVILALLVLIIIIPTLLVYLGPHDRIALVKVTSNDTSVLIGALRSCLSQTGISYKCSHKFTADISHLPNYAQRTFTIPRSLPYVLILAGSCMLICFALICFALIRALKVWVSPKNRLVWRVLVIVSFFLGGVLWLMTFFWFKAAERDFGFKSRDQLGPQFVAKMGYGFPFMCGAFIALGLLCLVTCVCYRSLSQAIIEKSDSLNLEEPDPNHEVTVNQTSQESLFTSPPEQNTGYKYKFPSIKQKSLTSQEPLFTSLLEGIPKYQPTLSVIEEDQDSLESDSSSKHLFHRDIKKPDGFITDWEIRERQKELEKARNSANSSPPPRFTN